MSTALLVSPVSIDFHAVAPGQQGPSITNDPSLPPWAVNFSGGVSVRGVSSDTSVRASVSGDPAFALRDLLVLDWVLEDVDPGELPPNHRGRPPQVKVLEEVARSDGVAPLAVAAGQVVLARVMYAAPQSGTGANGTLHINGDGWDPIDVPLSLLLSDVSTTFTRPPIVLPQGTSTQIAIDIQVLAGPDTPVQYEMSRTQLHSGVSLIGQTSFQATSVPTPAVLTFSVALDAPLGDNTLAIDQIALNRRTGMLVPVSVGPDPQPDAARTAIGIKAAARADVLGTPISAISKVTGSDGTVVVDCFMQQFEHGDVYYSPAFGAHEVHGDIRTKYNQWGGPTGLLGFPETDVGQLADRRGQWCDFHDASIYWHPDIGPRVVIEPIRTAWRAQGAQQGALGYPVRDHHPWHIATHVDLTNPNGVAWSTFENGAIVSSSEGVFNTLVAPMDSKEPEALEALKKYIRAKFDEQFRLSPDNVGLHPQVDLLGVLPWNYSLDQSLGRAILVRLHGFHDNGLAGDTDFDIDVALRVGWSLDPRIDGDTRPLFASLVNGYPIVRADGPGASEIESKVGEAIRRFFDSDLHLADVTLVAPSNSSPGAPRLWVVVDLIVGIDGGLRLLTNPEQKGIIDGGGPFGPSLRDQAETALLALLEAT